MNTSSSKAISSAVLAAILTLSAPLAMAQNIALVNGKGIPTARYNALVEQINKQSGQQVTPDMEVRVKEELVLREIFAQEAQSKGLQASAEYKNQMEFARESILIQLLMADHEAKNPVTEESLKAEYETIKAANSGEEFRSSHILVPDEAQARALIAQLKKGAKFADLARKNSQDPGSAARGGDLDWAAPGNYVPEFSQALVKLKPGQYTQEPVRSEFGYHIIKLDEVRSQEFPAFDQVRAQLEQNAKQARTVKYQQELKAKAKTDFKFSE